MVQPFCTVHDRKLTMTIALGDLNRKTGTADQWSQQPQMAKPFFPRISSTRRVPTIFNWNFFFWKVPHYFYLEFLLLWELQSLFPGISSSVRVAIPFTWNFFFRRVPTLFPGNFSISSSGRVPTILLPGIILLKGFPHLSTGNSSSGSGRVSTNFYM